MAFTYKEFIEREAIRAAKNCLYWMHQAADAMQNGDPVGSKLLTATGYAHEFELCNARTNNELNTGAIYKKAALLAKKQRAQDIKNGTY